MDGRSLILGDVMYLHLYGLSTVLIMFYDVIYSDFGIATGRASMLSLLKSFSALLLVVIDGDNQETRELHATYH